MTHPLHLDLPDHVYTQLLEAARQQGRTPEDVAVDLIESALHRQHAGSGATEVHDADVGDVALNRANDVGA